MASDEPVQSRDETRILAQIDVPRTPSISKNVEASANVRRFYVAFLETRLQQAKALASYRPKTSFFKLSLILWVAVPTIIISLYFFFIASDQFSVESKFAVRMAQFDFRAGIGAQTPPGVNAARSSPVATPTLANQEAYVVASYIRSAAIFDDFPKSLDIRSLFTRPEADFWARLKSNATREELALYWQSMIDASVNNSSGVVTLTVKAFRPEDAYQIATAIITASETLVNRLSERARNDAMDRAEQEVRRNEKLVRDALEDMRAYRDRERIIDPATEASSTSALLLQTMGERIRLQNEYFVATRAMSPNAPPAQILKSRLDAIEIQIEQLKSRMTGDAAQPQKRTISATIGRFEELELRRQFAEKLYDIAQSALERARQRVEWQNIYLSVFVPPYTPQFALFPERVSMSILSFIVLLITWGIFSLIIATVKDHMV